MKFNVVLFWILAIFFIVVAAIYTFWSVISYGQPEWAGTVTLTLSGILALFIAFYLGRAESSIGGLLPEDRLDADIDDGDPELGHFSPWSWWPVTLGFAVALGALGLAVGVWITFIGGALAFVALTGWVFEYYRGFHAR
ncbi:cytochrome c oxidase subunit 4 [Gryllotalpicola sp.]|uniref:cytochrome c oxidase subunit 4 n=1 Tax=Gryllotalpicola sp. TaxID=1932787 RepID=UPI0026262FC3|nr:cytochrome c oxidase subunit 4 [Gryllotalpicola sp.]